MRKVLSYAKSHIYEIHAIMAATITLVIVFCMKSFLKRRIKDFVEKKAAENMLWNANKEIYLKRCNGIILILMIVIAFLIFTLEALVSPFIDFSLWTAFLSGAFALTEYAIMEQLGIDI